VLFSRATCFIISKNLKSAIFSETDFRTYGNTLVLAFSGSTGKTAVIFFTVKTGHHVQAAARPTAIITTGTLK
jgi:hypothetical protein